MKFDFLKDKPGGAVILVGFFLLGILWSIDFSLNGDIKRSWLSLNFGIKSPEIFKSILIIGSIFALGIIA